MRRAGPALVLVLSLMAHAPLAGGSGPRRRVLIFGLDGCRPDALLAANTPNIDRLREGAAFSFRAQTGDVPISGPGWSSALTGVWRDKHGVSDNTFAGARFDLYPIIFCRLKAGGGSAVTEAVVRWPPLETELIACADASLAPGSDAEAGQEAVRLLSESDPDVLFVHLNSPDSAGHAVGFSPDSPGYLEAIEAADGQIGLVLAAVKGRPRFPEEEWLILVTTDHGGSGTDHHADIPENRTTFLIVNGPRVAAGEIEPPPVIVDVAATALTFLGIAIDPSFGLDGRPVALLAEPRLELPGDCSRDGKLDISDPLCLLSRLFAAESLPGPCDDGPAAQAGSTALLDANGDGVVDLSDAVHLLFHLFAGGPPPAAGSACLSIPGCPGACAGP